MFDTSALTINKSAYANNLAFIKEQLGGARLCSVVKGNAYGHGLLPFVPMANGSGVDYFAVYSADEAYTLVSSLSNDADLFIMGMIEDDAIEWAVRSGIEFCVLDALRLNAALDVAEKLGKRAKIHIELETGMNRTGFKESELPEVISTLQRNVGKYELTGLFTHFAGAESRTNDDRVHGQQARFKAWRSRFEQAGLNAKYAHQACSAVMMNFPESIGSLARVGIMQYGFWPNQETWLRYSKEKSVKEDPLRRLITWTSTVMAITKVKAGEFVGYGSSSVAERDLRVAVVPVGYAHGFDRGLSNTGKVLVHGRYAQVVGKVNMNAISIDVTEIEGVEKGDEVVLIGRQGDNDISVASFSEMSEQLNYEMLTRLPKVIPRSIVA